MGSEEAWWGSSREDQSSGRSNESSVLCTAITSPQLCQQEPRPTTPACPNRCPGTACRACAHSWQPRSCLRRGGSVNGRQRARRAGRCSSGAGCALQHCCRHNLHTMCAANPQVTHPQCRARQSRQAPECHRRRAACSRQLQGAGEGAMQCECTQSAGDISCAHSTAPVLTQCKKESLKTTAPPSMPPFCAPCRRAPSCASGSSSLVWSSRLDASTHSTCGTWRRAGAAHWMLWRPPGAAC